MTTIEPVRNLSTPTPGAPHLDSEMWASSAGRPFSSFRRQPRSFSQTGKDPGAPYIDSDVWASSAGRSLSSHILLCLALLTVTLPTQAAQPPAIWQLTWSDEFNGSDNAPPDPAKWSFETGGSGNGNKELETYTARPANALQQHGNLIITARKEDLTGPDGIPRSYTSARLRTLGHFSQTYGRFEARMQLPTGKGIWPAFWLLGDDIEFINWPRCGEVDIMENIGDPAKIYSTIHGPGYSGKKGISAPFPLPPDQSVHTAFHLYAVEWSPNDLKFFFDDHLIAERTPADLPPGTTWVYNHPFFLLLNLAVGGGWPGNPDQTTIFPQQMLVDYVRVYTHPQPAFTAQPSKNAGAPYLDSEMWASSAGRPSSSRRHQTHPRSKPGETRSQPASTAQPSKNAGAPYLDSEMWASSAGRPFSSSLHEPPSFSQTGKDLGAPYIDFDVWASSTGRPSSSLHHQTHPRSKPGETRSQPASTAPTGKNPGAPHLGSEMWASSEGRPFSSSLHEPPSFSQTGKDLGAPYIDFDVWASSAERPSSYRRHQTHPRSKPGETRSQPAFTAPTGKNPGAPHLGSEMWASSEGRPFSSSLHEPPSFSQTGKNPGAPYLDSEMWASSAERPSSYRRHQTHPRSKPGETRSQPAFTAPTGKNPGAPYLDSEMWASSAERSLTHPQSKPGE